MDSTPGRSPTDAESTGSASSASGGTDVELPATSSGWAVTVLVVVGPTCTGTCFGSEVWSGGPGLLSGPLPLLSESLLMVNRHIVVSALSACTI
jgi:hypothetical protein